MLKMPDNYAEIKQDMNKEMIEFMDLLMLKHATVPHTLNVSFDYKERQNTKFYCANFHDARLAETNNKVVCGSVCWWYGNLSSYEYVVSSRLIENNKFAAWNKSEFHSVRTKDVKKAVRKALDTILPVQVTELLADSERYARNAWHEWRNEQSAVRSTFVMDSRVIYEEIKHLLELGVVFKTPEFKDAVASMAIFEEHMSRTEVKGRLKPVVFAFSNIYVDDRAYPNMESLPTEFFEKVSMLKLLDDKKFMPEVGYKFDTNTFWIYTDSNN